MPNNLWTKFSEKNVVSVLIIKYSKSLTAKQSKNTDILKKIGLFIINCLNASFFIILLDTALSFDCKSLIISHRRISCHFLFKKYLQRRCVQRLHVTNILRKVRSISVSYMMELRRKKQLGKFTYVNKNCPLNMGRKNNLALYIRFGRGGRTWTHDIWFWRPTFYHWTTPLTL